MNDRDIITTAIAGCHDEEPINVVSIALELAVGEAEHLVQCFEPTTTNSDHSLAVAHSARLRALRAFISRHTEITFAKSAGES